MTTMKSTLFQRTESKLLTSRFPNDCSGVTSLEYNFIFVCCVLLLWTSWQVVGTKNKRNGAFLISPTRKWSNYIAIKLSPTLLVNDVHHFCYTEMTCFGHQ